MNKDAIIKIKNAEAEAEKIRSDSVEKSKEILKEAEDEGKRMCALAEADAGSVNSEKIALTKEKIDGMLEEKKAEAEESANAAVTAAELKMRDAAKLIIGEVMIRCQ